MCNLYAIYLQRYKKYPKPGAFHQDYFLTCIKNIKNIHILQYLLYLCKVFSHFRKSVFSFLKECILISERVILLEGKYILS